ncbi:uncharacterized protein HMPREF1541_07819 [Cyphellophora europaea CBS 101466]|uniref:RRM domain-containing protein n=1 Tax=Cyphellophora europaea (strain CBS 101466) TaxID=1220924 RepID=W2RK34_CYPE1|nr:uncharacterized protein HMPREF1541_07819 [Cyphellophora europaea CBS 101466]ETN36832.1 hypothetical protein HMPREF1541_07819 [Cyphellophora europaea CBS 101466]
MRNFFYRGRHVVEPPCTLQLSFTSSICIIAYLPSKSPRMFALRRSALRILTSSPASFANKPRTFTSLSCHTLRQTKPASQFLFYQRRWATTEAEEQKDAEEAPISKLQPTSAEEVENAIESDNAQAAATEASNSSGNFAGAPAGGDAPGLFSMSGQSSRLDSDRSERLSVPKPTVYVGNLFFDVTEDDVSRELGRFGQIKHVRLLRDSRGLSKGQGSPFQNLPKSITDIFSAATAAIEALHQQIYEGRRLVVQYAAYTTEEMNKRRQQRQPDTGSQEPKNPPSKTLFIGNMSFEMTDRDLNNLFRGIRNVVDVRVAIDRRTGQPRGFAHADFIDIKSAMEAMKVLKEKETYGRRLRVDYSFGNTVAPKNQSPPPSQQ